MLCYLSFNSFLLIIIIINIYKVIIIINVKHKTKIFFDI